MKRFSVLILVLVMGLIFAGCAQKTVTQQEQPQQEVQKAAEPEKKPEPVKEAPPAPKPEEKVAVVPVKEAPEVKPVVIPTFENIHFDFDKYNIRDDAKPALQAVSDWLLKEKSARMLIEGHCDERGTSEYNLALGERRAKSTKDYLVSLGVEKSRLDTISYGKERPLCKEHNEDCWQKNRRSQFIVKMAEGK